MTPEELQTRLEKHIAAMAPHQKERAAGQLLVVAHARITELERQFAIETAWKKQFSDLCEKQGEILESAHKQLSTATRELDYECPTCGMSRESSISQDGCINCTLVGMRAEVARLNRQICDERLQSIGHALKNSEESGRIRELVESIAPKVDNLQAAVSDLTSERDALRAYAERISKLAAEYEADPVNSFDRPQSWDKLDELLRAARAAGGEHGTPEM